MSASVFSFSVSNSEVCIKFSCPNHSKRISEIVKNLCQGNPVDNSDKKLARFSSDSRDIVFRFNGEEISGNNIRHEAVFYENTEYPIIVRGIQGTKISDIQLILNDHISDSDSKKNSIICDGGELYGTLNFRNQVGLTDIAIKYRNVATGFFHELKFTTEVLSYKLDYRSDLKTIIADIESEYAMLSSSLLKDTYLSMRQQLGKSTDLIWWQIFHSCYRDIINAARLIIDRPKRRLRSVTRYERAERLTSVSVDVEREYIIHQNNPAYLYRTEELILSHDTVENRFLKHAIREMHRRFVSIKEHIITAMHLQDPIRISTDLEDMESELLRLSNHPFFRGVGVFKGFRQDSLVMKQALGYKTIFEKWVELQQGYELEEGIRKLEVKDVSDLYEIWCFIKVKNIVQELLHDIQPDAKPKVNGRNISRDFIPQLVYGGAVSFVDSGGVELAIVSYNSQVEKPGKESKIKGTGTLTTTQRPDIVLRLSKHDDNIKYTYLFDAKYKIDDEQIDDFDVPKVDDIDQMHRYRDAIYYTEHGTDREHLKKEIIAGYVLFPGKISNSAMENYYYQKSNNLIGIGAFPLRPDSEIRNDNGELILNPDSSELALRRQIRKWLEEKDARAQLLSSSIPQKGLVLEDENKQDGPYFISAIDSKVNSQISELKSGTATQFVSGYSTLLSGINFKKIKYLAVADNHIVSGYYKVKDIQVVDMSEQLEASRQIAGNDSYNGYSSPFRVMFQLSDYVVLANPFRFGLPTVYSGVAMQSNRFKDYCKGLYQQQQ